MNQQQLQNTVDKLLNVLIEDKNVHTEQSILLVITAFVVAASAPIFTLINKPTKKELH